MKHTKQIIAFWTAMILAFTSCPQGMASAAEVWKERETIAEEWNQAENIANSQADTSENFNETSETPPENKQSEEINETEETTETLAEIVETIPADTEDSGEEELESSSESDENFIETDASQEELTNNSVINEQDNTLTDASTLEEREEAKLALVKAELEALVLQGYDADAFAPFLIIDNEEQEGEEADETGIIPLMDSMVLAAQQWLNETYTGQYGYTPVTENGKTGNNVVKGLITALQIELGIAEPTGTFGPTTASLCPTLSIGTTSNIVKILQYGLYCKGYQPGGATGYFGTGTQAAIKKVQTDAGLDATGVVNAVLFKAILNTDALVLLSNGDARIRTMQQTLNRKYLSYIGIMPCDGVYGRDTNKALIYALQAEEGLSTSTANGNFGPSTTTKCPTLSIGDTRTNYVYILQYALYCNGYDSGEFDGVYDSQVQTAIVAFQQFMCLPQTTSTADMTTIKSLLCSSGDTDRVATGCDASTIVTTEKAQTLKANGYQIIGRYLTGTVGGTTSKALTREEAQLILDAGLSFFPIYQDGGHCFDGISISMLHREILMPSKQ